MNPFFDVGRIVGNLRMVHKQTVIDLTAELRASNPVKSGDMQGAWRYRITNRGKNAMSASITNALSYSEVIALEGISPSATPGHPWAVSLSKSKGKKSKAKPQAKKIVKSKGKIWSTSAVGGMFDPTWVTRQTTANNLANRVADAIISGMK